MRKFLYLRMVAIITLVGTTSITAYQTYRWIRYIDWNIWFFVFQMVMALFAGHSVSVLYIYHRCYPNKELSRATDLFYRITSYGCGTVSFLVLLFTIAMISTDSERGRPSSVAIIAVTLIFALLAVQLRGGRQLFKTIQQNIRKQLENSFA